MVTRGGVDRALWGEPDPEDDEHRPTTPEQWQADVTGALEALALEAEESRRRAVRNSAILGRLAESLGEFEQRLARIAQVVREMRRDA